MNKTQSTKVAKAYSLYGYFAVGGMEARMTCPICGLHVVGYLPKYAKTYANGKTYIDMLVEHLMEEH